MNKLDTSYRFIIKWTKPGSNKMYYNHFNDWTKAENRYIYLFNNNCDPVWIKKVS